MSLSQLPNRAARQFEPWRLVALCLALATMTAIFFARGPRLTWDLLNYHYYNGFAFLHQVTHENVAPAQTQSFLNPLLDAGIYLLYSSVPFALAHLLLILVHSLQFLALYRLGRVCLDVWLGRPSSGLLAFLLALGGCGGSIFLGGVGGDQHDLIVSTLFVASLALVIPRASPRPAWTAVAAGVAMGFATGVKLTAAPYVLGVAVALCALEIRRRAWPRATALFGLSALLALIVTTGWWMLDLQRLYGSPVFPFLNQIFESPLMATKSFANELREPRNVWQVLAYPLAFTTRPELISPFSWRDLRFGALYLGYVAWAVAIVWRLGRIVLGNAGSASERARRNGPREAAARESRLFLIFSVLVAYLGWQAVFPTHRYLSGVEAVALLVLLALAIEIGATARIAIGVVLSLMVVLVLTVEPTGKSTFQGGGWPGKPPLPEVEVDSARMADSMVVVTGFGPSSFVIPSFPDSARFVRVQMIVGGKRARGKRRYAGLYRMARDRILDFEGEMYVLFGEKRKNSRFKEPRNTRRELAALGLEMNEQDCSRLTRAGGRTYRLCSVRRMSPE